MAVVENVKLLANQLAKHHVVLQIKNVKRRAKTNDSSI